MTAPPDPRRILSRRLALAATLALPACAAGGGATPSAASRGRVVLLRGLINIFSTGMDELAVVLRRAGYAAEVHNHAAWYEVSAGLVEDAMAGRLPRPVAVAGHSLGADDGLRLAALVGGHGLTMDLVFTFDPVLLGSVPAGPRRVVNYYQTTGLWGRPLSAEPDFDGELENVAVDRGFALNHFNIEKSPALHADVLARLDAARAASATRQTRPLRPVSRSLPVPPRPPLRGGG